MRSLVLGRFSLAVTVSVRVAPLLPSVNVVVLTTAAVGIGVRLPIVTVRRSTS